MFVSYVLIFVILSSKFYVYCIVLYTIVSWMSFTFYSLFMRILSPCLSREMCYINKIDLIHVLIQKAGVTVEI